MLSVLLLGIFIALLESGGFISILVMDADSMSYSFL